MQNGNSLTYLGVFDDVISRYPWDIDIDNRYLTQSIARHVIFGSQLLLNDGYLVMHPLCREAVLKGSDSPLFNLMADGFVRILSNGDSIVESILKRAESGVETHKALVSSAEWEALKPNLTFISDRQANNKFFHAWPRKDMTDGFLTTAERCRNRTPEELGLRHVRTGLVDKVLDRLRTELGQAHGAARTKWERIAAETVDEETSLDKMAALNELMGLANEIYHVNFSVCLSEASSTVYGVETRQSATFDELYDVPEMAVRKLRAFNGINIPNSVVFADPDKLRRFVVPGLAFDMKKKFLNGLSTYLESEDESSEAEFANLREEYIRFLSQHFVTEWKMPTTRFMMSLMLFAADTVTGFVTSPLSGLGLGALVFASDQYATPMVMKKVAVRDLENAIRHGPSFDFDPNLLRRLRSGTSISSISLDPAKASSLAEGIRDFS